MRVLAELAGAERGMDKYEARLEVALLRTARNVRRAYDVRLSSLDMNLTEASLLSFLRDQGELTQRELADRLNIGRAATGAFVEGLERHGLVTRRADPGDKRVWRVSLTNRAETVVEAFNEIDEQLRADLRANLSQQDRRNFSRILKCLEENALASVADPE